MRSSIPPSFVSNNPGGRLIPDTYLASSLPTPEDELYTPMGEDIWDFFDNSADPNQNTVFISSNNTEDYGQQFEFTYPTDSAAFCETNWIPAISPQMERYPYLSLPTLETNLIDGRDCEASDTTTFQL